MDLGNDREHLDKPTKCISAGNFCCFKSLQPAGGGPGYDGCRLGSSSDVVTTPVFSSMNIIKYCTTYTKDVFLGD